MPKQSRLAGFLGLEPYNAKDSDAQDSNTADTAPEEPHSHEQSGRGGEHHRAEAHRVEARAEEPRADDRAARDRSLGEHTASKHGAPAVAHPYTPETTDEAEEPREDRRGDEPRQEPASEPADHWEDAPVPNTEYTEQYADTYSNDGYYDQGYEPEETNGYTYGYEEEEDELRRITTIHPRSYNDAKIIGEAFRENIPVIMNVEEMPDADAKRLVDFASGLAFALEGRIERVTSKVFLLTPSNLEVLGVANSENTADFNSEGEFPFDQG